MTITREPLAVRGAVVAAIVAAVHLAVAFGWSLTGPQEAALLAFVDVASIAAVVVWTRGRVTPVADPRLEGLGEFAPPSEPQEPERW
jgi:hypothetical protein